MLTDKKIIPYKLLPTVHRRALASGQKIVFTTGSFDILHLGHVQHFSYCKSRGDILVVSVGSNRTIRYNKGQGRPIFTQKVRARMLAALACVDYVVMSIEFGTLDHRRQIRLLQPNIYVFPITDTAIPARKQMVHGTKTKIIYSRRWPPAEHKRTGVSTSRIIAKLSGLRD